MKRFILFTLIFVSVIKSQTFDGASLGMAGNYSAISRGVNAIAWNPANLALCRGNTVELNLFSLNAAVYNNSFSLHSYNRYFTAEGNKGFWTTSDKNDLLDLIDENGLDVDLNMATNVFGLAFNNFALTAQVIGQGQVGLSGNEQLLRAVLFGENLDKNYEYHADEQYHGSIYSAGKISWALAYPFKVLNRFHPKLGDLAVGIGVNYYLGISAAQVIQSNVLAQRITVNDEESVRYLADIKMRVAKPEGATPAGKGMGFDLGVSASYNSKWRFSMAAQNLFAKINWSSGVEYLEVLQKDSLSINDLNNKKNDTKISIDTSYSAAAFSTSLPATLTLGAAYQIRPDLMLTADWRQGLNHAFGNSTTPRLGVGAEYRYWKWLPVRAGFAMGGGQNFLIGLGFGLNFRFFDLDYSYAMKNALWPTYSEGLFTALSIKFKL
jgi:hypothetical protein